MAVTQPTVSQYWQEVKAPTTAEENHPTDLIRSWPTAGVLSEGTLMSSLRQQYASETIKPCRQFASITTLDQAAAGLLRFNGKLAVEPVSVWLSILYTKYV